MTSGVREGNNVTTITITDNEDVAVSVPVMDSFSEGEGTVQVCATLSDFPAGGNAIPISVTLAVSPGSADSVTDYTAMTAPLEFPIGSESDATQCRNITIIDDARFEGDETFTVGLTVMTSGVRERNTVTTITITDNEVVTMSVPAMETVGEEEGTVQVCATLSDVPAEGNDIPISITLATSDSSPVSAVAGSDYTPTSSSLMFPTSSDEDSQRCITVSITDDGTIEGDETFTVGLTVVTPGVMEGNTMTIVSIITNNVAEFVNVRNNIGDITTAEGVGVVPLCITISQLGPSGNPIERNLYVNVSTVDGSAVAGSDYVGLDNAQINLPPGSVQGSEGCVNITIINDNTFEGVESFTAVLTPEVYAFNFSISGIPTDMISITDNEFVTVNVPTMLSVGEGDGTVEVCVILSDVLAPTETPVSVMLSTSDSSSVSAGADVDYTSITISLMFPVGATDGATQCVNITITEDSILERDETFTVELSAVSPVLVGNATTRITITDNDVVTVSVPTTESVVEGDVVQEVCATLSGVTDVPINIMLATNNSTASAVAGLDYTSTSSSLEFPAGSTDGAMQCINITIQQDSVFEGSETFTVQLTILTLSVMEGNTTTTVTIIPDDDSVTVSVPTMKTVGEGDGTVLVCVALSATNNTERDFSVTLATATGTATNDSDYTSLVTDVTFPSGSPDGAMQCVEVNITDDMALEANETFTVGLTTPVPTVLLGNNVTTIQITDNDVVTVSVPTMDSVGEGDGTVQVCATLSDVPAEGNAIPISITLATSDSSPVSAAAGSDYTASTSPFEFTVGSADNSTQCITISITSDTIIERDETFTVGLTVMTSGVREGNSVTTITITDDDETFFQLRLTGVENCRTWRMTELADKGSDVVDKIVEKVVARCGCDFTEEHITDRVFQCFPSSPQSVVYHARLHRTPDTSVAELIAHIQQWVSSDDVTIAVQLLPLSVDDFCALSSSTPVEQCPNAVTLPTTGLPPYTEVSAVTISIAASVVAVLVLVLVASIITIVVVLKCRRRSSLNLNKDNRPLPSPIIIMNTLSAVAEESHDYEDICVYSTIPDTSLAVDSSFDITSCPAYKTTMGQVNAARQKETTDGEEEVQSLVAGNESEYETMDANHVARSATDGEEVKI